MKVIYRYQMRTATSALPEKDNFTGFLDDCAQISNFAHILPRLIYINRFFGRFGDAKGRKKPKKSRLRRQDNLFTSSNALNAEPSCIQGRQE
ncbi:MAG: hypothetical protein HYZ45_11800 [Burkholderiales bacterium]|nr:hypothetical protein [Burkholderiales bacterium]